MDKKYEEYANKLKRLKPFSKEPMRVKRTTIKALKLKGGMVMCDVGEIIPDQAMAFLSERLDGELLHITGVIYFVADEEPE